MGFVKPSVPTVVCVETLFFSLNVFFHRFPTPDSSYFETEQPLYV